MASITSLTNSKIKSIAQLRSRKQRDKTGLTIIEGYREMIRAFEAKVNFTQFFIEKDILSKFDKDNQLLKKLNALKVPIYEITKDILSKISYGDRNEGILGISNMQQLTLNNFSVQAKSLFVIVEKVEKPGNLGAVLRSCDGTGVDGVIICEGKTDIYNPNVIRASLGTVFSLKVVTSTNKQALDFLKTNKIKVCAAISKAKTLYTQISLKDPLAIIVGSEQEGLSDFWIQNADHHLKIPMQGKADSLNVSCALSVLLYEAVRQRLLNSDTD